MHRDVTLDKIGYMMGRMGGDDELSVDDLESLIIKVFVSSFEYAHGFEAALIQELLAARYALMDFEAEDENEIETIDGAEAEQYYLKCQAQMYQQAGCTKEYAEESASWPDELPLHAQWDKKFLREMARKEIAHHLVVMDQIRAEMEKRNVDNADS